MRREKPRGDRKQQRATTFLRVGSADPYGVIEIRGINDERLVTVTSAGLPSVQIRHPDGLRSDRLPLDDRTTLTIGGLRAVLSPGRGVSRTDRAVRIDLGNRKYTYGFSDSGDEELRSGDGTALTRKHLQRGVKGVIVSTTGEADDTDLALALAFLALETHKLSMSGLIVGGVLDFFNNPRGDATAG